MFLGRLELLVYEKVIWKLKGTFFSCWLNRSVSQVLCYWLSLYQTMSKLTEFSGNQVQLVEARLDLVFIFYCVYLQAEIARLTIHHYFICSKTNYNY